MFSLIPMWACWLIIATICFLIEIFTISFLMFWPGIAAVITMFLSLLGIPVPAQVIIFSVISIVLLVLTKPLTKKLFKSNDITTNVESIIGKKGTVKAEVTNMGTKGQVKVEGELWTAITDESEPIPVGAHVTVIATEGVKIKVKKI